jgi:hypothetical protein
MLTPTALGIATLVPEIDEPPVEILGKRQRHLIEEPIRRVQRVFTMPVDELCSQWKATADVLRSKH